MTTHGHVELEQPLGSEVNARYSPTFD